MHLEPPVAREQREALEPLPTRERGSELDEGTEEHQLEAEPALQDAASVAGLLITTEAMVTDRPEPKPAMMPHDDHGMGGMGGF